MALSTGDVHTEHAITVSVPGWAISAFRQWMVTIPNSITLPIRQFVLRSLVGHHSDCSMSTPVNRVCRPAHKGDPLAI